jgi:hypothetical protein
MKEIMPVCYEPKRNHRFVVEFPEQFNIESFAVQKINKPKFSNGKWENIKVEFVDLIGPSTSQSLFGIVKFLENNKNDSKILFELKIKSLDPTGVEVEEWLIYVEEVSIINFGELDYGDDGIQKPYLIIKPLKCILKY